MTLTAPMPRASVAVAPAVKAGERPRLRAARRRISMAVRRPAGRQGLPRYHPGVRGGPMGITRRAFVGGLGMAGAGLGLGRVASGAGTIPPSVVGGLTIGVQSFT